MLQVCCRCAAVVLQAGCMLAACWLQLCALPASVLNQRHHRTPQEYFATNARRH